MVQVLCPRLLGREAEMRALGALLRSALAGEGGCAALLGEPGIGKSRLAREVARQAADGGAVVVIGRAVPTGGSSPYRPLTEALLQGLRGRDMPADPGLSPWLPALAGVVPVTGSSEASSGAASPAVRGEAVLQLMSRLAQAGGLVLVLEDLHWADADTLAVVEYLGDNLGAQPIMCLITLRDEPPSPALALVRRQRGRPGTVQLTLGRLDGDEVGAMVQACVPGAGDRLVDRVRRTADGVPLLVEEILASPGLPASFAETVKERLGQLGAEARLVLEAAAVLGRRFDWELLPAVTGLPLQTVAEALQAATEWLLLRVEDGAFQFRHALTREALLDALLPPRHRALAATCLTALQAAHPDLDGTWRDLAADLAARAGDRRRAAALLTGSGRESLQRGALATAIHTLSRAVEVLGDDHDEAGAWLSLVEALALAGRVDEAVSAGTGAIAHYADRDPGGERRAEVHLRLAQAAVAASRWTTAVHHLDAVRGRAGGSPGSRQEGRVAVLDAEVALAHHDLQRARDRAARALAVERGGEVCCQALEVIGRVARLDDPHAARAWFEQALATAEAAQLTLWRLRALHELGTVDLFDHAGTERLLEARRVAGKLGAVSTAAVLDLQLAAAFVCRWDPEGAAAHAQLALDVAQPAGLGEVRAKALVFLAESHALGGRRDDVERYIALALSVLPAAPSLEGFCWGARGEVALVEGDWARALECLHQATTLLGRLPHAEPAAFRALWPLLLASVGDRRARDAVEEARPLGVEAFNLNRGLLAYAQAVLAGRAGEPARASRLAASADLGFVNCGTWAALARLVVAEAALKDGWGEPERWLGEAGRTFTDRGLGALAERCGQLLGNRRAHPWGSKGVTEREAEVARLVAEGMANKEIAARLEVSPRTVEKHVEALLRKTSARSRTQLAVLTRQAELEAHGAPASRTR